MQCCHCAHLLYSGSPFFLPFRTRALPAPRRSTYNYMGRVYNKLIAAYNAGDMVTALAHQRTSQVLIDLLNDPSPFGSGVYLGKAIMEARLGGKHCGPPRYPQVPMTPEAVEKLAAALKAQGFFEW